MARERDQTEGLPSDESAGARASEAHAGEEGPEALVRRARGARAQARMPHLQRLARHEGMARTHLHHVRQAGGLVERALGLWKEEEALLGDALAARRRDQRIDPGAIAREHVLAKPASTRTSTAAQGDPRRCGTPAEGAARLRHEGFVVCGLGFGQGSSLRPATAISASTPEQLHVRRSLQSQQARALRRSQVVIVAAAVLQQKAQGSRRMRPCRARPNGTAEGERRQGFGSASLTSPIMVVPALIPASPQ